MASEAVIDGGLLVFSLSDLAALPSRGRHRHRLRHPTHGKGTDLLFLDWFFIESVFIWRCYGGFRRVFGFGIDLAFVIHVDLFLKTLLIPKPWVLVLKIALSNLVSCGIFFSFLLHHRGWLSNGTGREWWNA